MSIHRRIWQGNQISVGLLDKKNANSLHVSLLVHWDDIDNNLEPQIFSFQLNLNHKPWRKREMGKGARTTGKGPICERNEEKSISCTAEIPSAARDMTSSIWVKKGRII